MAVCIPLPKTEVPEYLLSSLLEYAVDRPYASVCASNWSAFSGLDLNLDWKLDLDFRLELDSKLDKVMDLE